MTWITDFLLNPGGIAIFSVLSSAEIYPGSSRSPVLASRLDMAQKTVVQDTFARSSTDLLPFFQGWRRTKLFLVTRFDLRE